MKKGFENLTKGECLTLVPLMHKNSAILLQTARQASQEGNFGVARSLVVLGSEEYIKGAILFLNGIGVNLFRIKEIRKALNSHKQRHQVAMLFRLFQLWETFKDLEEYKPKKLFKKDWLNDAYSLIEQAAIIILPFGSLVNSMEWWDKADGYKNAGFYVDYFNGPVVPQDVSEQEFKTALRTVEELINKFEEFMSFIKQEDAEVANVLVASLNKGLTEYENHLKQREV